jgi:hypothetical protein
MKARQHSVWTRRASSFSRLCAVAAAGLTSTVLAAGCQSEGKHAGVLVGVYAVRGVLAGNTCGPMGLPAQNPLSFSVEIREDDGLGYWFPSKAAQNTGSFNARGEFSFSASQTKIVSMGLANPVLQPSDFTTQQADFDIRQTTCAVSVTETIAGSVSRREAADGGAVVELATTSDAAVSGTSDDLTGSDVIDVAPTSGSDCNADLTAFGGSYQALPCRARYVLTGTLMPTDTKPPSQAPVTAGAAAAH